MTIYVVIYYEDHPRAYFLNEHAADNWIAKNVSEPDRKYYHIRSVEVKE